eukprot:4262956-Pleurochrysis_carterae.AAC.6
MAVKAVMDLYAGSYSSRGALTQARRQLRLWINMTSDKSFTKEREWKRSAAARDACAATYFR